MDFLHDIFGHHWMFILFSAFYMGLEALFPISTGQRFFRKEFGQDILWYIFNNVLLDRWMYFFIHYFILIFAPLWGRYVLHLISPDQWEVINHIPIKIENQWILGLVLFISLDFLAYWVHYLNHRIKFLWNCHILHHSSKEMDWLSGSRSYWLDAILSGVVPSIVLIFLEVSEQWIFVISLLDTQTNLLTHANIRFRFGPLDKIFSTTQSHRWHHDINCHHRYGQNFGHYTLIWDKIFGTYHVGEGYPAELGVSESIQYPKDVLGRFLYPLKNVPGVKKLFVQHENFDDDILRPNE